MSLERLKKGVHSKIIKFIKKMMESFSQYRVRKIRLKIKDMDDNNERIIVYKLQLVYEFGGIAMKR